MPAWTRRGPQGVDWQVAIDGVEFADNPNFEAWMPNYQESFDSLVSFISVLRTDPDLDVEAEIADFMEGLQTIFDRAGGVTQSGPSAVRGGRARHWTEG